MSRRKWSPQEIDLIYYRAGGCCYLCRDEIVWDRSSARNDQWHVEHVIAFSEDAEMDILGNALPACATCNLRKGSKHLADFRLQEGFTVATFALHVEGLSPETQRQRDAERRAPR